MNEPGSPIVIDLGKKAKKQIKDLKAGVGKLTDEVLDATAEVKRRLGADAAGKEFVPIVVVYERKRRAPKGGLKLPMIF